MVRGPRKSSDACCWGVTEIPASATVVTTAAVRNSALGLELMVGFDDAAHNVARAKQAETDAGLLAFLKRLGYLQ